MKKRVVVWGTGNVGRPAIRAVHSHQHLELAGVIVANPVKAGRDVGELVGIGALGVIATTDAQSVLSNKPDAVIYCATADTRPDEALQDLILCLRSGCNVLSTSFYPFLHPASAPEALRELVLDACLKGNSSLFVSGIDPGWALDILPLMLSGVVADIQQIRCQEIFNYALYDQPEVVRNVIGFGLPMADLPIMLHDFALKMVWEPMVRLLGEGLAAPVDTVETLVERRPLEHTIQVPGMGQFDKGSQGAFRFEVQGMRQGKPVYVVEHITRIDDSCAPDWPYPPEGRGCHRILIKGRPNLEMSFHSEDPCEPGPGAGGNATAANRLVNAVDAVCAAPAGFVTALDLPIITGAAQLAI